MEALINTPEGQADYQQQERDIQAGNAQSALAQALASPTSPDDAAKAVQKGRRYGVPAALAGGISPQQEAQDRARLLSRAYTQPAVNARIANDFDYANIVKDDLGNTSTLAMLHWKMWGNPGEKPDTLRGALSNSTARGGYLLANTLPGLGSAQRAIDDKDELKKLERWASLVAKGETPEEWKTDVDPTGHVAMQFWAKNGESMLREYEARLKDDAEAVRWSQDMADLFPKSAASDQLAEAKTFGESVGAIASSPLMSLADMGPESLVQSAPALLASALLPGAGAAASMGAYSAAQDRSASFIGNMADYGVDLHDSKQIANFLLSDGRYDEALRKANAHAAPVGLLDALSFGAAKLALPREIGWLKAYSPKAERAYAKVLGSPFRNKFANLGAQTALQGAMGGAGEALGQINAEGKVTSWSDVVAEFAGEGFSAPVEVMSATRSAWATKTREAARAKMLQELLKRQGEVVQQSKVMERDPQTILETVSAVNEEREAAGEAPAALCFDGESLNQDAMLTRLEKAADAASRVAPGSGVAARLGDIRERVKKAAATGDDVTITPEDFMLLQKVDGELAQALAPHAHIPGDTTLEEANLAAQEILDGQTTRIAKAASSETPEFRASLKSVGEQITAMLNGQQNMGEGEKNAAITLLQTLVGNTAKDAGMTPEEVWKTFGLTGVLGARDVHVDDQGRLVLDSDKAKSLLGGASESERAAVASASRASAAAAPARRAEETAEAQGAAASAEETAPVAEPAPAQVETPVQETVVSEEPSRPMTKAERKAAKMARKLAKKRGAKQKLRGKDAPKIDLNQASSNNAGVNGSYIRGLRVVIRWASANQSTFLHETGHMFLDLRLKLATQLMKQGNLTAGQQRLVDLAQKTVQWLGAKDLNAFNKLTPEQQRPMHEKFARTYEAYLAEGNAPTVTLRTVFRQFTSWLKRIYGAISAIPEAEMSDEVRALFDGLFVAQEQEQAARTLRGLYSLADELRASRAGGDPDSVQSEKEAALFAQIQKYFAESQAEAEEILRAKGFRSMCYIRRLHDGIVKKLHGEAKKLRAQYAKEELKKLLKEKPYATYALLHDGMIREDGSKFAPKLLEGELVDLHYPKAKRDKLFARGLSSRIRTKNSVPGEAFAQSEGFTSLAELVNVLTTCDEMSKVLEARVDNRMIAEHADLNDEEAIQKAADAAIFNPSAARMLALEISYLEGSTGGSRVSAAMFQRVARTVMGGQKWREVSAANARAKAAALGRQALMALRGRERDTAKAAGIKRQQLYQTAYAIVAEKTRDAIERAWKRVQKERDSKTLDRDFKIQLEFFVAQLGGKAYTANDRVPDYTEFQAQAATRGLPTPDMPPAVADVFNAIRRGKARGFGDLTVDEALEVAGFLRHLATLGRDARTAVLNGERVSLEAVQEQAAKAIIDHAKARGKGPIELGKEDNNWKKTLFGKIRFFDMMHRRVQSLLAAMEGGHGILYETITKWADACATKKEALTHEVVVPFDQAMSKLRSVMSGSAKVFYPELGASLTKRQIVAAILNCGTESGRERLIAGSDKYDWTVADESGAKKQWSLAALLDVAGRVLTEEDIDNIQKVLDTVGSLWEEVVALEEREGNRAPKEEVASSITIPVRKPDGSVVMKTMKGGYYPVKYDRELSAKMGRYEDIDFAKQGMAAAYGSMQTRHGHTMERSAQAVGDPIELTMDAGLAGLANEIHDLCWREFLNNTSKLMQRDGALATAIRRYWGAEAEDAINQWLKDIRDDGKSIAMGDDFASIVSRNVSFAGIGFNLITAAIQPIGILQSVAVLGGQWTLSGVSKFMENPFAMKRMVEEMSPMMAARARTRFRELAEIQLRSSGKYGRARDKVMRAAYVPIVAMQALVDIPTWLGAYHKALAEGKPQDEAVAMADRLTIEAQGSGRTSDLSRIERMGGFAKVFTTFYTFFNAAYNIAATSRSTDSTMKWLWNMTLMMGFQPVIETFVREGLKAAIGGAGDDDGDDWLEKTAWKAVGSIPNFGLNMFVITREFADVGSLLVGEQVSPYQGPAGLRAITDVWRLAKQLEQGEMDEGLLKAMVNVTSLGTGLIPAVPINRAISGFNAMEKDSDVSAVALLLGAPAK